MNIFIKTVFLLAITAFTALLFGLSGDNQVINFVEKHEGSISQNLTPAYLKADFTGDGVLDYAFIIDEKLCIFNPQYKTCTYTEDKFDWSDEWKVITERNSWEVIIDENGDMDEQEVLLQNDSLEICKEESSCSVISIKNNEIIILQQSC